ncbi:lysine transporter LysE [Kangiella geojedonensis]|uniref:Lysine transporter LysE n=2 Tax=Kangiella geojedonensis TaxID=914150 RepID=A0A0F6RDI4_9GAMM|nr:LysE family translocator [Kangiella geojedonensis]AKE52946.1 lysine transporter LysE [Kangiella geojedonensis]
MQEFIHNIGDYWQQFLLIASAHLLAVMSPGPDFAIVMRQSLVFGKRFAIITSLGIGLAIFVHVAYAVLGIGLLIQSTEWLFKLIQLAGAGYLIYIGYSALQAKPDNSSANAASQSGKAKALDKRNIMTDRKAFRQGFVTNVLNPKATLFFLSLFTTLVDATTPLAVQSFYGIWMAVVTAAWFVFLSYILASNKVRGFFAQFGHWIDRILGGFLIALALFLLWSIIN